MLKIEYLDKKELKPYEKNAKIHTKEQVAQIRKSIEKTGFNDPIGIWGKNEVVEGHGRLMAVMQMDEIKTVPVIRLDHLTDKQRKAYALAHNKLTMNTDFDLEILAAEIAEIGDEVDLTDIGFNEAEILELSVDDSFVNPEPRKAATEPTYGYQGGAYGEGQDGTADYGYGYAGEQPYGGYDYGDDIDEETKKAYKENAESKLQNKRIIIVYRTEEEEAFLKSILKQQDVLPVVLDIETVMGK